MKTCIGPVRKPECESPPGTNRIKVVRIGLREIMAQLYQQDQVPQCIALPLRARLPDGCRILAVHLSNWGFCVEAVVEHPSFEPVPEGTEPPLFGEDAQWWMFALATDEEVRARPIQVIEDEPEPVKADAGAIILCGHVNPYQYLLCTMHSGHDGPHRCYVGDVTRSW